MKRILYLGYYVKNLNFNTYFKFLNHSSKRSNRSKLSLIYDSIVSVFKYNISLLEFFQFRFDENTSNEYRESWAGTGFMYEYQLRMNPPKSRVVLDNKVEFSKKYAQFLKHKVLSVDDTNIQADLKALMEVNDVLVLKDPFGKCGSSIEFYKVNNADPDQLLSYMRKKELSMIETVIRQHDELARLSPSGVNTVRIVTEVRNDGSVDIIAARLRISVDSVVDNLAAGNIAALVDIDSGKVISEGIYSDITKPKASIHPITGEHIVGFKIPYWEDIKSMCNNAALVEPQNKSVGWDVVVTSDGPSLIEGNHDWCKLLWQLPANEGLKKELNN